MKPPDRQLHRLAALVLASMRSADTQQFGELQTQLHDLQSVCQRIQPLQRLLNICQNKHWVTAGRSVLERIQWETEEISRNSARIVTLCKTHAQSDTTTPPPNLRDVVNELRQINEEFDGYDAKARTISVTTEPITLEDINLGRFKIELEFKVMADESIRPVYTVQALEPNSAACNDAVTHPHVRDENLCEGDATIAIKRSLESGRLCDFFVLVRSVLQTYNSGSPFVALDNWHGVSCHDCGCIGNESCYCECCQNDFCEECFSYCHCCDTSMCRGCLETCTACDDLVCSDCRKPCKTCRELVCVGCLEDELCPTCKEKVEEDNEQHERERTAEQREHDEWVQAQQLCEQQRREAEAAVAQADASVGAAA